MSTREHSCPKCHKEWHCEGCHTRETVRLCDTCMEHVPQVMPKVVLLYCGFCGQNNTELEYLIHGIKDAYICSECIDLCVTLLTEKRRETETNGI